MMSTCRSLITNIFLLVAVRNVSASTDQILKPGKENTRLSANAIQRISARKTITTPSRKRSSIETAFTIRGGAAKKLEKDSKSSSNIIGLPSMYHKIWSIPEPVRFVISGNVGTMVFLAIERIVYLNLYQIINGTGDVLQNGIMIMINKNLDSVSFFLGYLIQIVSQHYIHAVLVYGLESIDTREKYLATLGAQYNAYIIALIGSTILNKVLLDIGIPKTVAFISTLSIFAFINYFLCSWVVNRAIRVTERKNKLKSS